MFLGIGRYQGDNIAQMGGGVREDLVTRDWNVKSSGPCGWLANYVSGKS